MSIQIALLVPMVGIVTFTPGPCRWKHQFGSFSLGEKNSDGVEEHKVSISYSYTQSRVDLMEYTVGYQPAQPSLLYNNTVGFTGNIASGDSVGQSVVHHLSSGQTVG